MKLCEKLVELRRAKQMTQEELAERLHVSRQAVSRWEMGTAMPDAANILQLSRLFGVTTDYLLNDDYVSDADLPPVRQVKEANTAQIMIYLVTLEGMIMLIQFMCTLVLANIPLSVLSFALFAAPLVGFELAYRRTPPTEATARFRLRFYKISAWLGLFFPIAFGMRLLVHVSPHVGNLLHVTSSIGQMPIVAVCMGLALYIVSATLICLALDRANLHRK